LSVEFGHPYATPTLTLELRNPELGDSEAIDVKTQFKIAMNGDIHSHRRTPENHRLLLSFTAITKALYEDMITFIETSVGDEVRYTDYNSDVWRGYILTNPLEGSTVRKIVDGTCIETYTFTIEYQGYIP